MTDPRSREPASEGPEGAPPQGRVEAVARDGTHRFSKPLAPALTLLAGLGVEGDAHAGETVRHRSRVRRDPSQPNLRQVHLMPAELFETLAAEGVDVAPGDLGENVTTRGIDLFALPRGTCLQLGAQAVVEVTGLRNPCAQIESFRPGLLRRLLYRGPDGMLVRRAGIMGVVRTGGRVTPGDPIFVTLPVPPHAALEVV